MDSNLNLDQVYAPPAASPPATSLRAVPLYVVSPYVEVVRLSFPIGVVVGLVFGSVVCLQSAYALGLLDTQNWAPAITCAAVIRVVDPSCAVIAVSLTAVVLLHRAGRRARGSMTIDHAGAYLVAATLPLLSFVTATFCLLGAFLAWPAASLGTTSQFLTSLPELIVWTDFVHGLVIAAVGGLWVTCMLRLGAKWLATKKRGLALKLIVAYATIRVPSLVYAFALELWFGFESA
jgi:hypothetical protein